MVLAFLAHPATAAFGVPLIFLLLGAVAKKLIRKNERGLKRQDFYLGVQATLASISAAFLYMFELLRQLQPLVQSKTPIPDELYVGMLTTAAFIVVAFCSLLFVLSLHQDWEATEYNTSWAQFKQLGLFANGIGLRHLAAFIFFIKTV
ncbi:MAG TPA: hypothetical protein VNL14_06220 [Candidatus Acidoferrales bacterium]|nr:hypothetical protein [Candidatus Acidoferrales bacterium]